MAKKTCKKCLKSKSLSKFVRDKRSKGGVTNSCKECRNATLRKGPSKPKRYIGKTKQECTICREIKPLKDFNKRKSMKNGLSPRCKDCTVHDPKPYKAYWRLIEKQKLFGMPVEITKEEVKMIFDAYEYSCVYCGAEESEKTGTMQLEHVIPISKGGRHHVSNLVTSCKSCNSKKKDSPLIEFYRSHEPFNGLRLDAVIIHVAYFSKRDSEEVAKEFYAEVNDGKSS